MVLIGATGGAVEDVSAELLAVGLYKGEAPEGLGDAASEVVSSGDFAGKLGDTSLLYGQEQAPRLLLVGLGERESFDLERLRRASATAARRARALKLREAAFSLPQETKTHETARAAAEGAILGLYRFDRHKSAAESHELETLWLVSGEYDLEQAIEGTDVGQKVA
ncbi:MAG TPA: M17 family peptidase N-terminal domain-containing protein, partial [Rubrobacteraceae bacterium]|nr:M17 family peptidase N-terminal domain-containing protein [Rubrobacteraceae bacterium]